MSTQQMPWSSANIEDDVIVTYLCGDSEECAAGEHDPGCNCG